MTCKVSVLSVQTAEEQASQSSHYYRGGKAQKLPSRKRAGITLDHGTAARRQDGLISERQGEVCRAGAGSQIYSTENTDLLRGFRLFLF